MYMDMYMFWTCFPQGWC